MKEWFTHQKGYVNIDDQWIYLTSTGNWSETKKLEERSRARKGGQNTRGKRIKIGFVLVATTLVIFTLAGLINQSFVPSIFGVGTVVSLWIYLQREMGPTFKINRERILKIEFDDNYVTLIFKNRIGERHEITLDLVEEKGCDLLYNLALNQQIEIVDKQFNLSVVRE